MVFIAKSKNSIIERRKNELGNIRRLTNTELMQDNNFE